MYPPYKNAYKRPFWSFVQGGKMKKITLICACVLLFTAVNAEQMQFVTTMSAPVGNFAHLDAADSTHVTSAPILNFCNTRSSVGKIVIKGAGAYLKQIDIQNGTTLGSTNTPEYRLGENLSIENGGTVTAGRVMAKDVTFEDTNFHKSNVAGTIYGNDVAVMGGKTDNMDISGTAKISKSAQNSANLGEELWWDNQYASDYDSSGNKKSNGKTYTSFLLKSKTAVTPDSYKFKAVIKKVKAAKICGQEMYTLIVGPGTKHTKDQEDYYKYADYITQERDVKVTPCTSNGLCGGPNSPFMRAETSSQQSKTTFTNEYPSQDCPEASSNDKICADNCDSSKATCSYSCIKTPAQISGCGYDDHRKTCYCPCFGGNNACSTVFTNPECERWNDMAPILPVAGTVCERTKIVYEPLLGGTGQVLTCVAE